jgi:hypothetical protein
VFIAVSENITRAKQAIGAFSMTRKPPLVSSTPPWPIDVSRSSVRATFSPKYKIAIMAVITFMASLTSSSRAAATGALAERRANADSMPSIVATDYVIVKRYKLNTVYLCSHSALQA